MSKESLSIVFSTRTDNPAFRSHLTETCGIGEVEILQYVNNGEYSLTAIYNRGLREATNTVVVFSHDDVIFEAGSCWGRTILRHFRESDFGILGKAGTTSIPSSGRWWEERHLMVGVVWHEDRHPGTGELETWENRYSGDFGDKIIETIMVDGLFFAVSKERIRKEFDEDIRGFHFYDVDFGLSNHFAGVRVGVIFDMKITHKSIGRVNERWEQNRVVFLNKWKLRLPCHIEPEIAYDDHEILPGNDVKVAVIILAQNGPDSLIRCIESIRTKTRRPNYKFYIAGAGTDPELTGRISDTEKKKDEIIIVDSSGTPGGIMNNIVKNYVSPDTGLLLFCHDDVELLNDAVSRCVQIYIDAGQEIGTLGIRLHLGNNSIQHAGIQLTVDRGDRLRISHKGYGSFYNYTPGVERDIFSSAGAFMMLRRELFLSMGGFSERYSEWMEDIDLNFRVILAGRINYFTGEAVAYHYELETVNDSPEGLRKKTADLKSLLAYVRQHLNNPMVRQHLKYMYT